MIGIGAATAALVILIAVIVAVIPQRREHAPSISGCKSDADCSEGRFCAAGGCIILIPSEHRGIWRDDIAAQMTKASARRVVAEVGVRLPGNSVCPLPQNPVPPPKVDKTRLSAVADVLEVHRDFVVHHRYLKAICSVWLDTVRFEFEKMKSVDPATICGAPNTAGMKIEDKGGGGSGNTGKTIVDVLLKNAQPANKPTITGISFRETAPIADAKGEQSIAFDLTVPNSREDRFHTMVAFPLGAEILSISGPPPSREKLLKGYVIYDFTHGRKLETIVIRYKVPSLDTKQALDVTTESL